MYRLLNLGSKIVASNFKTLKEPYKLTFSITNKCNSKCKTCGIWKKKNADELDLQEIDKIFKKINPLWINITGGEPFLRNDLYEIAEITKKKDAYLLNLTTNGLLEEKIINDVNRILKLNFPRFIVVVSLDGSKEVHDKIRGINGNWDKAISLFKKLREIENQNKRFKTYFGYTISSYNIGMLDETLKAVKKETDENLSVFHFNIFHNSSFYYGEYAGGKINGLENKILKEIKIILKEKKGIDAISLLEKRYLKNIQKYFETGKSPKRCKALISSCFIAPNGDIYPCTIFNKKLGNLRDFNYDLKTIWQSDETNKIRNLIKENSCGGCWTPCEAYQTILGNILRK